MTLLLRSVRCWCAGILTVASLAIGAANAGAQDDVPTRAFVNVNLGVTMGSKSEDTRFTFPLFGEDASVGLARKVGGSGFPDVTGGIMLSKRFGVALNYSRFTDKASGNVNAELPDPAFYDTPHAVAGTVDSLQHQETWIALLLAYPLLSRSGFDVTLLGGPAVARVSHEVATEVVAPTTASVALTLEKRTRDLVGGQVGVDVRRGLGPRFGVGAYVRYSAARGHLGAYRADLGGVQLGGGARFRF